MLQNYDLSCSVLEVADWHIAEYFMGLAGQTDKRLRKSWK